MREATNTGLGWNVVFVLHHGILALLKVAVLRLLKPWKDVKLISVVSKKRDFVENLHASLLEGEVDTNSSGAAMINVLVVLVYL